MVHSEAEELAKEIRTAAQHLDPIGGANREVEIFSSPRRPEGGHEEIEIFTPRNNPKSPYRRSPFYAVRTLDSIHREHEGTVSLSPGSPGGGIVSYSIAGHLLNEITPEQAAALIRQQLAAISRQRRSGRSHQ